MPKVLCPAAFELERSRAFRRRSICDNSALDSSNLVNGDLRLKFQPYYAGKGAHGA